MIAPPSYIAVLFSNTELLTVNCPLVLYIPPPRFAASLFAKIVLSSITVPSLVMYNAAPFSPALLCVRLELVIVRLPEST